MSTARKGDPCRSDGKQILLVEGKDDCHVILALCKYYNIPESFGVYQCESWVKVLQRLDALIPADQQKTIGVVLDADDSVTNRWEKITKIAHSRGYLCPSTPDHKGTVLKKAGLPDLGIWLMPNNSDPGMLEDFLLKMADPKAHDAVKQCIEAAQEAGFTAFKTNHKSKAEIHTYLAWQDEPGKPLGQAITAHALRPRQVIAEQFVCWLQQIFN